MRRLRYVLSPDGLYLTEFANQGTAGANGVQEGTIAKIHIPFGELLDMMQDLTYNSKNLLLKTAAKGEVEVQ